MAILKGKGFILRQIRMDDAKAILECYQDKETSRNYRNILHNMKDAKKSCKKWIDESKKKIPSGERWIIDVNGEFAGWITLSNMNEKYSEHIAYLGYCIHPKFRGKGLATSATKILSKYAFKKYNLKRISAICRTFNKASARVLDKSGFKLEGIMRNNTFKDGKYMDDILWARTR